MKFSWVSVWCNVVYLFRFGGRCELFNAVGNVFELVAAILLVLDVFIQVLSFYPMAFRLEFCCIMVQDIVTAAITFKIGKARRLGQPLCLSLMQMSVLPFVEITLELMQIN